MNVLRIEREIARVDANLRRLRWRMERQERPGVVKEYDKDKHRVRLQLNPEGSDNPFLSPWLRIDEANGQHTIRTTPTIGQLMIMVAPNGDIRQAKARFGSYTDEYKSPSTEADETRIARGSGRVNLTEGQVDITHGGGGVRVADGITYID